MVGGQVNKEDEVSGVSGGAEDAASRRRLVTRTAVDRALGELVGAARPQPHDRKCVEQNLGQRFVEYLLASVPARAL